MQNKESFIALLQGGLWNKQVQLSQDVDLDYGVIMRLAEEQSVVGIVAAGAEWFTVNGSRCMIPLTEKLTLLGKCQLIEQRNEAMNRFVARLIGRMREAGINALLMKGQGLAQCYERPMWRLCDDVDLFLESTDGWEKKCWDNPYD